MVDFFVADIKTILAGVGAGDEIGNKKIITIYILFIDNRYHQGSVQVVYGIHRI